MGGGWVEAVSFQLELHLEIRKQCINWFSVAVTKIPWAGYVGKVGSLFSREGRHPGSHKMTRLG